MMEFIINGEHVVIGLIVIGYITGFFLARNIIRKETQKTKSIEGDAVCFFILLCVLGPLLTIGVILHSSVVRILK